MIGIEDLLFKHVSAMYEAVAITQAGSDDGASL